MVDTDSDAFDRSVGAFKRKDRDVFCAVCSSAELQIGLCLRELLQTFDCKILSDDKDVVDATVDSLASPPSYEPALVDADADVFDRPVSVIEREDGDVFCAI